MNLTEIVKNQNNCIKSVDENKLYLQENNIYPTQEGLFLIVNDNGDYVHLPSLFSDAKGCYIHFSKNNLEHVGQIQIEVRNECPHCGERYVVVCKNKDCPGKKKKDKR